MVLSENCSVYKANLTLPHQWKDLSHIICQCLSFHQLRIGFSVVLWLAWRQPELHADHFLHCSNLFLSDFHDGTYLLRADSGCKHSTHSIYSAFLHSLLNRRRKFAVSSSFVVHVLVELNQFVLIEPGDLACLKDLRIDLSPEQLKYLLVRIFIWECMPSPRFLIRYAIPNSSSSLHPSLDSWCRTPAPHSSPPPSSSWPPQLCLPLVLSKRKAHNKMNKGKILMLQIALWKKILHQSNINHLRGGITLK